MIRFENIYLGAAGREQQSEKKSEREKSRGEKKRAEEKKDHQDRKQSRQ